MNSSDFKKLVTKHFTPNLKQLGWKGNGFHFYQSNPNHIVNLFGFQGSWFGGSICCETAIHFDFIPDLAHKEIDISKTTFASCIIRNRLSPKGEGDYHWTCRDREEENIQSITQIWNAFKTHGENFYNDFANFPYPFDEIKPQALKATNNYRILNKYHVPNKIHLAWLLKEINLFIGRHEIAKEFSNLGMTKALENAEVMSKEIKSKNQQKEIEKYIEINKELFKI